MEEKIEILNADLMKKFQEKVKLIEYWASLIDYPVGWHYWLDFIWILNNLEEMSLPRDVWVMDGGAGNGLLQFILASSGYNVISLDYAERDVLPMAKRIFDISEKRYSISNPEHFYRRFIDHKQGKILLTRNRIMKSVFHPWKAMRFIFRSLSSSRFGFLMKPVLLKGLLEARSRRRSYGKIIYALGDFTDLKDFQDESVDCIVSVSALEHNDPEDIKKAVAEFNRILKRHAYMFVTVSAAKEEDWFFKPCRGWCFTEGTLKDMFGLGKCDSNFGRYGELFHRLESSQEIKKRIAKTYFQSGDNGLPWGKYEPKYQPVGIVKRKNI